MNIAPISISLPVQHIAMSMAFYETLGFGVVEGGHVKDYAVLYNGEMTIGLYRGIELLPLATIKSGWDSEVEPIDIIEKVPDFCTILILFMSPY